MEKLQALKALKARLNLINAELVKELEAKQAINALWNYTKNKNNRTAPQNQ
jgi:hypothetical protein